MKKLIGVIGLVFLAISAISTISCPETNAFFVKGDEASPILVYTGNLYSKGEVSAAINYGAGKSTISSAYIDVEITDSEENVKYRVDYTCNGVEHSKDISSKKTNITCGVNDNGVKVDVKVYKYYMNKGQEETYLYAYDNSINVSYSQYISYFGDPSATSVRINNTDSYASFLAKVNILDIVPSSVKAMLGDAKSNNDYKVIYNAAMGSGSNNYFLFADNNSGERENYLFAKITSDGNGKTIDFLNTDAILADTDFNSQVGEGMPGAIIYVYATNKENLDLFFSDKYEIFSNGLGNNQSNLAGHYYSGELILQELDLNSTEEENPSEGDASNNTSSSSSPSTPSTPVMPDPVVKTKEEIISGYLETLKGNESKTAIYLTSLLENEESDFYNNLDIKDLPVNYVYYEDLGLSADATIHLTLVSLSSEKIEITDLSDVKGLLDNGEELKLIVDDNDLIEVEGESFSVYSLIQSKIDEMLGINEENAEYEFIESTYTYKKIDISITPDPVDPDPNTPENPEPTDPDTPTDSSGDNNGDEEFSGENDTPEGADSISPSSDADTSLGDAPSSDVGILDVQMNDNFDLDSSSLVSNDLM